MSNRLIYLTFLLLGTTSTACAYDAINVKITNTLPFPRKEVTEIPVKEYFHDANSGFTVIGEDGKPVSWQISHDGKLLILADVNAESSATYRILQPGTPVNGETVTFAQTRPDCQDDIAWENDRCGYRLYGPSFRNGGGTVHGYDIWSKCVEYPLLSKLYHDDKVNGITYHKNHGEGFDGYTVGPTLGACMNALMKGDSIFYPTAYRNVTILDNGPIRTSILVECFPENICGDTVTEKRLIILDAGSVVNRTEVNYTGTLGKKFWEVAGIVVHADNPDGYSIDRETGIVTVDDYSDDINAGNGSIYIGFFSLEKGKGSFRKFKKPVANAVGEVIMKYDYNDKPFVYYWGSGWSQQGISSSAEWKNSLSRARECILHPLEVSVSIEKKSTAVK